MSDRYTEVTRTSWFGRIGNSFAGILIGLVLLVGSIWLLFWNEGRAVVTAQSLAEGNGLVVAVDSAAVQPANEGKLVHATGTLATGETLNDGAFGISAKGVRLVRAVEMYQWKQTESSSTQDKLGGGQETVTTYSYSREWSSSAIKSGEFKKPEGHQNPPMTIQGQNFQVGAATLGGFRLDRQVLDQVGGARDLPVTPDQLGAVRGAMTGGKPVNLRGGTVYVGSNPDSPAIGDYRISWQLVPLGEISVVGRQTGQGLSPYQTNAGDRLLMVDSGNVPAGRMFADAESGNAVLTWVLRAVGLVLLFVAFSLLFAPLSVIASVIPFLGSLVGLGTGIVAFALALLVGSAVIAIAWFWYRPLLAFAILAVGIVVFVLISRYGRGKAAPSASGAASGAAS